MLKKDKLSIGAAITLVLVIISLGIAYAISRAIPELFLRKHYFLAFIPSILLMWYYMRNKISQAGIGSLITIVVSMFAVFVIYFLNLI